MKQCLFAITVAIPVLVIPVLARANPEPTSYDSRSIAMGLTGTSYLERPAALVINPANLEGIEKLGFTFNFNALFVNQWAPVQGPNTRVDSGVGFGPIPAGFIAGRIAPRVVFGAGIYIETGYGSDFDGVTCLDGADVTPDPRDGPAPSFQPATGSDCRNTQPEDLNVTFFVGEFSAGTSIRVTDTFWLGVALRLPFSKQVADLYQNVGAALGTVLDDRVKNNLGGVGFPSPRIGLTWKPHPKVSIGAMYRMYSKIKLTGTTESQFIQDFVMEDFLPATADWFLPHAFQVGIAIMPNERLLLAFEGRMQFHAAPRTGNRNQTVVVDSPTIEIAPIVVPFGWRNAWSVKAAAEYRFPVDLLAIRGGANFARSATTGQWAQYFTPPPGFSGFISAGLGFYWDDKDTGEKDKFMLDLAGAFSFSVGSVGDEFIGTEGTIPGTDDTLTVCSADQVVRTGCPGDLGVYSYFLSLGFTLQY